MKINLFGIQELTVQDSHGVRLSRDITLDDKRLRQIIVQPPSDDRLTALSKKGPATLTMPEEGETFQTLGVQLWLPHTEKEGARIIRVVPNLLGVAGVEIADVNCYDAENMISWRELHVSRPEEAGSWTPETAYGLLNAVHLALTTEVLPPHDDGHAISAY